MDVHGPCKTCTKHKTTCGNCQNRRTAGCKLKWKKWTDGRTSQSWIINGCKMKSTCPRPTSNWQLYLTSPNAARWFNTCKMNWISNAQLTSTCTCQICRSFPTCFAYVEPSQTFCKNFEIVNRMSLLVLLVLPYNHRRFNSGAPPATPLLITRYQNTV